MRNQFPFFNHHPSLVYLDSAATSLKLASALKQERLYEEQLSTNATRGLYPLAEKTDALLTQARESVAHFLGAVPQEIIFTSGTTAGANLLAYSLENLPYEEGEVLVSLDNHHSHFLPWQRLAEKKGWEFIALPVGKEGLAPEESLKQMVTPNTRVVALTMVSNVYGVKNDIPKLTALIRATSPEAFIILDAAQAAAHYPIDVTALGADALIFSGHKTYASTGVGVLWLSQKAIEKLPPAFLGGGMVLDVVNQTWKSGPEKFEAGTLPLAQIFGLAGALDWLEKNRAELMRQEAELIQHTLQVLPATFGNTLEILGSKDPAKKVGLFSFTLKGMHPHDIASLLGENNICVRAGEHCASPLHQSLSLPATTRISFGPYTTTQDIDTFIVELKKAYTLFEKTDLL
jgi:cysteine desulfurase/selenocysteine lyase